MPMCQGPGGGVLPYQNGGGVPPEPHGAHGEREIFSSDRERKMAKNRGICAAHTCIPQYREYPPPGAKAPSLGTFKARV